MVKLVEWLVSQMLTWAVSRAGITSWVSKKGDAWIVYMCLVIEHALRHRGKFNSLKNKCGTCRMLGHNAQNCPESHGTSGWKKFADERYVHAGIDEAVDAASSEIVQKTSASAQSAASGGGDCTPF
jgi:hypothetical protein